MKIRHGFVSNSSSSSFVIVLPRKRVARLTADDVPDEALRAEIIRQCRGKEPVTFRRLCHHFACKVPYQRTKRHTNPLFLRRDGSFSLAKFDRYWQGLGVDGANKLLKRLDLGCTSKVLRELEFTDDIEKEQRRFERVAGPLARITVLRNGKWPLNNFPKETR